MIGKTDMIPIVSNCLEHPLVRFLRYCLRSRGFVSFEPWRELAFQFPGIFNRRETAFAKIG